MKRASQDFKFLAALTLTFTAASVYALFLDVNDEVLSMGIQSDGKIVVAGKFTPNYLLRRNPDGTIDETFENKWSMGGPNGPVYTVAVQSDDKILMGGRFTAIDQSIVGYFARLNPDGTPDVRFLSHAGTGFDDEVTSVSLQPDGRILVAGRFSAYNGAKTPRLTRLKADGSLDETFRLSVAPDFDLFTAITTRDLTKIFAGGEPQGTFLQLSGDGQTLTTSP